MTSKEILEIVFNTAIKAGVGEVAQGAVMLGKKLLQKIRERLSAKPIVAEALKEAETSQSNEPLKKVEPFLDVEMLEDAMFANDLKESILQIKQEINTVNPNTNIQIVANSNDNSKQTVVGVVNANTANF